MSPLSALAPDQRAVLELLLRQGRSYSELSELLGLPESGVRTRAHAALAALAPGRPAPIGEDGAVADWILGQQDPREAERTRESVARMPAWHAWASEVADRLAEVEGAAVPDVPEPEEDDDEPAPAAPAARPRPVRQGRPRPLRDSQAAVGAQKARRRADAAAAAGGGKAKPRAEAAAARSNGPAPVDSGGGLALRSSKLGGALLIGAALLLIGVVLFVVLRGGDEEPETASTSASPTASATPQVIREIALKGVGNKAQGLMRVFRRDQDGSLVFALAADKMPRNKAQEVYAVWFTKKGVAPRNLGFSQTPVGKNGVFTTGGPQSGQEGEFAKWLVDYDAIVVARAGASSASAKEPGEIVLRGTLPGGED